MRAEHSERLSGGERARESLLLETINKTSDGWEFGHTAAFSSSKDPFWGRNCVAYLIVVSLLNSF